MADSSKPDIDSMLLEFLKEHSESKAKGVTIEGVHRVLSSVVEKIANHEKEDENLHREIRDSFNAYRMSSERRISLLERDVEHISKDVDRVEDSASHDIPAILAAAKSLKTPTPPRSGFAKALETEVAKGIGKGAAVVVLLILGWLAHHIQVSWSAEPVAKPALHEKP